MLHPALIRGTAYAREQEVDFILVALEEAGYFPVIIERVIVEMAVQVVDGFLHRARIGLTFSHPDQRLPLPDHGQDKVSKLSMKRKGRHSEGDFRANPSYNLLYRLHETTRPEK